MRKIILCGIFLAQACIVASADEAKPVIELRIDATVSEVQAKSTFQFAPEFLQGIPGKEFINKPHVLVYKDDDLYFRIEDAGGAFSRFTQLGYVSRWKKTDPESTIDHFTVHPGGKFLDLPTALARAKQLRDDFLSQGFVMSPNVKQIHFMEKDTFAPANLHQFENLETAFLDSFFFAKTARVFYMEKNKLEVRLELANYRRRWGSLTDRTDDTSLFDEERAATELNTMKQSDLLAEPVYLLSLVVGGTNEWTHKRWEQRSTLSK